MNGVESIAAEREAQIRKWGDDHDDDHDEDSLTDAAVAYAERSRFSEQELRDKESGWWPWETQEWKPGSRRRMLVKAGALLAAEIDKLDRIEPAELEPTDRREGE